MTGFTRNQSRRSDGHHWLHRSIPIQITQHTSKMNTEELPEPTQMIRLTEKGWLVCRDMLEQELKEQLVHLQALTDSVKTTSQRMVNCRVALKENGLAKQVEELNFLLESAKLKLAWILEH